jgi:acyl-CoA dehydrogenase
MTGRTLLGLPFFEERHRVLAREISTWAAANIVELDEGGDVDAACRTLVGQMGEGGWLRHVVPSAYGGAAESLDVRSICLLREHLAYRSGLADFAFALQGLGTGSITLFGSESQKLRWLPPVARGESIAAFAISEPEAGSDIGAMRTTARRDGGDWVIDGGKTWISNAGIADHYVVFAREPEAGDRAWGAFIVPADTPGLRITGRIEASAPHVLGTLAFDACRLPAESEIGETGKGLRVALATLDTFRPTVGAAAVGFARRAFDEAAQWTRTRRAFGRPLADHQMTAARIADMAVDIETSALLVYRAAWLHDTVRGRITTEAAMAKLHSTEAAQRVVDGAVQLLGGRGVVRGETVERLYREVRALRIYEGTSEIQKIVIAGQVLGEPT